MQAITITQITPLELETLIENSIKRVLSNQKTEQATVSDLWFDLNDLCDYHPDKPKPATVYGWVFAGKIPVNKGGKKLRFLKSEIDEWLKQGRKVTVLESSLKAEQYLKNKLDNSKT